jgi:hypothetical protein
MRRETVMTKVAKIELTCIRFLLVCWFRKMRDSFTLECVLRTLGTANWLNFVPVYRAVAWAKADRSDTRLSFFVVWNVRERWFFDIYIQGSKKIQL